MSDVESLSLSLVEQAQDAEFRAQLMYPDTWLNEQELLEGGF